MNKKLCVIMSLYKNDKLEYIKLAIDSILKQSFKEYDFYIQIDGPIKEDCSDYLHTIEDKRLLLYSRDHNLGLTKSLNELLNIVLPLNYDYIARMDADDISHQDRFQKQVEFMDSNTSYELVGSSATLIDANSKNIGEKNVRPEVHHKNLLRKCDIIHPSVLTRSSLFLKVGLYDEQYPKSQDYELWLRASLFGIKMFNLSEKLLKFRYEPDTIIRRKNEQKYNILIKRKYNSGVSHYFLILPNVFIMVMPNNILKVLLKIKQLIQLPK